MKYERKTSRNEEPFYAFDACKECEQKDGCDKWCAHTVGAYTRLHELEDKIESGELVDCKEVVKECLQILRDIYVVYTYEDYLCGWNDGIDQAIKRLAEKYNIDVEYEE